MLAAYLSRGEKRRRELAGEGLAPRLVEETSPTCAA